MALAVLGKAILALLDLILHFQELQQLLAVAVVEVLLMGVREVQEVAVAQLLIL